MKRSSKGKAYFYAMGQRQSARGVKREHLFMDINHQQKYWPTWAQRAHLNGYNGF